MVRPDAVLNKVLKMLHYCNSVSHVVYITISISVLMVSFHNVMKKYLFLFHLVPFSEWHKIIPGTLSKTIIRMK